MEIENKRVLGLELPTDPRWANLAEMDLQEILTDHAFCEQKATTYCISLIQRYPEKTFLLEKLTPVVSEEWSHFRLVLKELNKRGFKLGHQRKDVYIAALLKFIRPGVSPEMHFLERVLVCAMIEARSCERFRLLSLHLKDPDLKQFYYQFMVSEASHYKLFLEIATHYVGEELTRQRWKECLAFEAEIIKKISIRGDRIH